MAVLAAAAAEAAVLQFYILAKKKIFSVNSN
jgi:hypothetical protein